MNPNQENPRDQFRGLPEAQPYDPQAFFITRQTFLNHMLTPSITGMLRIPKADISYKNSDDKIPQMPSMSRMPPGSSCRREQRKKLIV